MSMLKSEQTDYHNHQAKTMEQVAVYNAPCWLEVMQKMALSFLVVLIMLVFAGQAHSADFADPFLLKSENATGLVDGSFRMAQVNSSMENWQKRAFSAIELQKRLDNLARDKKKRVDRNKRIQRAVLQRQKNIDGRRRQVLERERQRNKIKLRRSIRKAAARRRAKKLARMKNRSRSRQESVQNKAERAKIVTEPVKIQRCLKKAGYFTGVVTGRLDDATLLAFLAFREDENLQSRPNDLYDPKTQEVLFALCPDRNLNSLNQYIANTLLGKKPVFVTSVRALEDKKEPAIKQAAIERDVVSIRGNEALKRKSEEAGLETRTSKKQSRFPTLAGLPNDASEDDKAFAIDVLAATDKSRDQLLASGKNDRMGNRLVARSHGKGGATSSFAMKRPNVARPSAAMNVKKVKLASLPVKASSPFARKLSISDLAMAGPSNPNTCSPQTHQPALAMSTHTAWVFAPACKWHACMDEAPLTTGAQFPLPIYARPCARMPVVETGFCILWKKKKPACRKTFTIF